MTMVTFWALFAQFNLKVVLKVQTATGLTATYGVLWFLVVFSGDFTHLPSVDHLTQVPRAPMLSGEYEISMDDKGRIIVPTRLREELGANVVLWRGFDGQVMIHPKAKWEQAVNRLTEQETQQRIRQARWALLSGNENELDRQGRMVIPPALRRHAGLGAVVVVVGMDDHLEIWGLEHWEKLNQEFQTEAGEIANTLAAVGIKS